MREIRTSGLTRGRVMPSLLYRLGGDFFPHSAFRIPHSAFRILLFEYFRIRVLLDPVLPAGVL